MSHKVIFALSQDAQRAAVLAGEDARAVQEFSLGSYDTVASEGEHCIGIGCKLNDIGKARIARALALGAEPDRHGTVTLLFGVGRTDPRQPHTYSALGTEALGSRPKTADEALDMIEAAWKNRTSTKGSLTDREKLLGDALRRVLVHDGVLREDAAPTGPELLAAAEHYMSSKPQEV